ncbi:MAG: NAD-dependent DNA ligase LigA [Firmicutes bacterium]|nr:NAD-dependent DNA ligase LigA [Bacillota bacterium]
MAGASDEKRKRMTELVGQLDEAARAYYTDSKEIMTNFEYDRLYDELEALEKETGIVMAGSPTQRVGYELLDELPKERHEEKMLSLGKTKDPDEIVSWLGDRKGVLSWKLDGLTVVLTYQGGELVKAVTRGNGEVGEVITNNARVFSNIPLTIPYKDEVILRGEATISYAEFERINAGIGEADAKYKNPRNLCSGSVRQLNNKVTAERNVRFTAFALVKGGDDTDSRMAQFDWMSSQGFAVVDHVLVDAGSVKQAIADFEKKIPENEDPSDGLVLIYEDIAYGKSLGVTAKYPRDGIAFKWRDEIAETTLREIEWSASRTGLINPIAVFDPVELEGTTVSRASVHNVSIVEDLKLGIGDTIRVYKANMIIPQIAENVTKSGSAAVPDICPVCGGPAAIRQEADVRVLICGNPSCPAKQTKSFALFASRDAMNIEGLSEQTIEKLISAGALKTPADLFRLGDHAEEIASLEGMGEKSLANLMAAADKARKTNPARLLYALGITGIGSANAGMISRHCGGDWEKISSLSKEELLEIDGVGEVLADAFTGYFADEENRKTVEDILSEIEFEESAQPAEQKLEGLTFVITGSLEHFSNRKELQELIQDMGGKAAGSVSGNTSFLINNDKTSSSSKNKKAAQLGVPVITEEDFMERFGIKDA